jgi:dipeptidyl aminopeptidase/acylaminoacyl peptidase
MSTSTVGFQEPSAILTEAVRSSARQGFLVSSDLQRWALANYRVLLRLEDLKRSELRLAGLRFHPERRCSNRDLYYHGLEWPGQGPMAGLPELPDLRNLSFSPSGDHLAFTHCGDQMELWVAPWEGAARRLELPRGLNQIHAGGCLRWLRDSSGLLALLAARPAKPVEIPDLGPQCQESLGEASPSRTFQDLLKNPHDEDLFEHYLESELWQVPLEGPPRQLYGPSLLVQFTPSPDGQWIYLKELMRPFSYQVTWGRFPCRHLLLGPDGQVQVLSEQPLHEAVLPDFDAVRPGARFYTWREDRPASLIRLESADQGDPRQPAEVRDRLVQLELDGQESLFFECPGRIEALYWGEQGRALVQEGWWKTRRRALWQLDEQKRLLLEWSREDDYVNPGRPLTQTRADGRQLLQWSDQDEMLFVGPGHSPEGERPFLKARHWHTQQERLIFQSQPPYFEQVVGYREDGCVVTQRETPSEPPNLCLHPPEGEVRQLTAIGAPFPPLQKISKEILRYRRADGVELTGTLHLPPDAQGPLPLLMWAYPQEYKSAERAGQLRDSPYRYTYPSWSGGVFFTLLGYAVLEDPTFPIVGEGEQEPNDTYVDQLLSSVQAAIEAVAAKGWADPQRVALGGHSYGAFTTANVLAHSRLLRCGIARSGAYNRTLTPFGFQNEERTYWQAKETYEKLSPFRQADGVRDPLLIIHGAEDSNSGTHPMQSERLYAALKGLGAPARLVMLPYEDHGYRAEESVLHVLWESERWLAQHLSP